MNLATPDPSTKHFYDASDSKECSWSEHALHLQFTIVVMGIYVFKNVTKRSWKLLDFSFILTKFKLNATD